MRRFGLVPPAEYESLNWQQHRLNPQQHGMHEADGVDHVEAKPLERSNILRFKPLVVACVSVGDATATRRHAVKPTLV